MIRSHMLRPGYTPELSGERARLGLQTARELGVKGISVVLGVRDLPKAKAAVITLGKEGIQVEAIRLDLANFGTHEEAFSYFSKCHGHLDILVNNAAVWLEDPPPKVAQLGGNRTSTLPIETLERPSKRISLARSP